MNVASGRQTCRTRLPPALDLGKIVERLFDYESRFTGDYTSLIRIEAPLFTREESPAADMAAAAREIDAQVHATDQAYFVELARNHRRMRRAAAHRGKQSARDREPADVVGRRFVANQDHGRMARQALRLSHVERQRADRNTGACRGRAAQHGRVVARD